jgi:uncharacterized protein (DUF1330 family)
LVFGRTLPLQGESLARIRDPHPRENRNESRLDEYRQLVPASFQKHPAKFRAIHGRQEVLEGSAIEEIVILEFPSFEDATAWYHSPEYQAAREHRLRGGDYRCIITEGLPT